MRLRPKALLMVFGKGPNRKSCASRRVSVYFLTGVAIACCMRPESDGAPAKCIAEFDMAFHEERVAPLEVLIKLSGGEYRFAIDTGSSQTTFDNRLLPLLRRNARSSRYFAPGGNRTVDSYRSPAFHMGALRIEPLDDIHCEDLTMLSANGAARMDGVLGMDAIRAFVMALDFDAGKLRFFAKCPDERSAISIPLKRRNGVPVVNAVLGALGPRDFVIDTGCNIEAALSDDLFRTLARSEKLFLVGNVDATSAMGTHGLRLGVLESTLELGHCKVRNMVVCELPISEQRFNVLGLDYLL